jgi:hypothetical protein
MLKAQVRAVTEIESRTVLKTITGSSDRPSARFGQDRCAISVPLTAVKTVSHGHSRTASFAAQGM